MPSARFSSKVVAVLFVFALLLVTVQLAFTAVGTTAGAHWGDPVTVATTNGSVTSLSTAGGDDGAVVAWIVNTGDRWRVEVANVSLADGSATVESPRTVASSSSELDGVDVAVDGNRRAIVWKVHDTNRIRLRTEGRTRTISSALRTRSPSVAFVDGRPVSAWIAYRNASFDLRTTSGETKQWIAADPGGVGSPTVVGGPNGGSIVWREGSNWTAETIPLDVDDAGHVALGKRRSLGEAYAAGGFGTSVAGAIDAAGSNGRVRAVWTNQRVVTAATVEGRNATDPVTFGPGQQPRIAARDDQWIAAWLIETKNRGYDLQYRTNGGTTERAVSLPGNSLYPSPVFGPSAGLVWTENTGSHTDVLVSAYRPHETASVVRRLSSSPERLGFVTLAASVVGAVTLPMMPWVDASFVGAFLLTTGTVSGFLFGVAARIVATSRAELRARAMDLPSWAWIAVFVAVETGLLSLALPGMNVIEFSHPLVASGIAVVVAAFARIWIPESMSGFWKPIALFAYVQTAVLWVIALPGYL